MKKKRQSVNNAEESGSDANVTEDTVAAVMPPPPIAPQKKLHHAQTKTAKATEDSLRDTDISTMKTPARKPACKTLTKQASTTEAKISPSSMKPPSTIGKSPASQRGQSPDAGRDDVSIAESSKTVRKTEGEREQFFRDQPECSEVEPHRAFCTGCNEWVALNARQTYSMRPWLLHRRECRRKSLQAAKSESVTPIVKSAEKQEEESEDDGSPSAARSGYDKVPRKAEAERQAYLEADPHAEEVRPYEVLCRNCQKWVKLGAEQLYALGNWKTHQQRCPGSLPSSRVATAERKLKLVNDSGAKSFTTTSVECASCGIAVALEGEGDYDLTKWDEHKLSCESAPSDSVPTAVVPDAESVALGEASARSSEKTGSNPPPSVSSTETAVAPEALGGLRPILKRARDDDEEVGDERPRTRARTESYRALDWLLLPFKSFIHGFKAGMQSTPAPSPSSSSETTITISTAEGTITRPLTAAEKKREKKLRDDPLAAVLSPLWVECKRCGSKIKLSPKSTYDPFHWQKHRERCLKRSTKVVKDMKQDARDQRLSSLSSSPAPGRRPSDSPTPPLTSDSASSFSQSPSRPRRAIKDQSSEPESEGPRSPSPPPRQKNDFFFSSLASFQPPGLLAFEEYLHRSRRRATRTSPLPLDPHAPLGYTPESWQKWSWNQLKAPVWIVKEYPKQAPSTHDAGFLRKQGEQEEDDEMDVDDEVEVGIVLDEDVDPSLDSSSSGPRIQPNISAARDDVGDGVRGGVPFTPHLAVLSPINVSPSTVA
ncbi:hypothetical protein EW146_g5220 [Bondarzewia mesenterica]|uniref:Uncharacterized protein n=1 Tax=Bondarzewia mesenterica TaxID=1095465 RepID=A0A4S4LS50_9AGAM|nr:hypothetical protein EW146_g5220 [Bondarzewia mesenterica]